MLYLSWDLMNKNSAFTFIDPGSQNKEKRTVAHRKVVFSENQQKSFLCDSLDYLDGIDVGAVIILE